MKSLLLSLLLVPMTTCLLDGDAFSRGSCLQKINEARSAFADRYQLANMNDLMYNKKLEKRILEQLSFTRGCPQPSIISHNQLDFYLNVKGADLIVELLEATGSTQMACVKTKCGDEDVISVITDVSDSPAISGSPGSECSSGRSSNSIGLCTLENHRGSYARKGFWGDVWNGFKKSVTTTTTAVRDEIEKVAQAAMSAMPTTSDESWESVKKRHGYARKGWLGDLWNDVKKVAEDVGKAGTIAADTVLRTTNDAMKEVDKALNPGTTTYVMTEKKVLSEAQKKMVSKIVRKAAEEASQRVVEAVEEESRRRGYARKGLWGLPFDLPTIDLPAIEFPEIELPEIEIPDIEIPNLPIKIKMPYKLVPQKFLQENVLEDSDVEEDVITEDQFSDDGGFILVPERPEGSKPLYG